MVRRATRRFDNTHPRRGIEVFQYNLYMIRDKPCVVNPLPILSKQNLSAHYSDVLRPVH